MKNKSFIPTILLLIAGEILLIISFLHFGKTLPDNILAVNTIVSSIIYLLIIKIIFFPWINLKNKTQREVGTIGPGWVITLIYTILAIAVMMLCNFFLTITFTTQLIVHSILFFILLTGLFAGYAIAGKTKVVFEKESEMLTKKENMCTAINTLKLTVALNDAVTEDIKNKVLELYEQLRFLSPCNASEANELEHLFIEKVSSINELIKSGKFDHAAITKHLFECEQIYQERKKINSI